MTRAGIRTLDYYNAILTGTADMPRKSGCGQRRTLRLVRRQGLDAATTQRQFYAVSTGCQFGKELFSRPQSLCGNTPTALLRHICGNSAVEACEQVLTLMSLSTGHLGTGFYRSNEPTNSVKALKELVVIQRIRLQSHQVHLTMLQ